jgi:hypothetical protein
LNGPECRELIPVCCYLVLVPAVEFDELFGSKFIPAVAIHAYACEIRHEPLVFDQVIKAPGLIVPDIVFGKFCDPAQGTDTVFGIDRRFTGRQRSKLIGFLQFH